MPLSPARKGFRLVSLITALSTAAACAPVGPGYYAQGPYQQQASGAAYACQQGIQQACYDYQAYAPAANAEVYQEQQNAQVGTAVAAGLLGAVAGAAIASSGRRSHYRDRGYYGPRRGYYRGGYHRY
ncbi:hypothetical protein EAH89_16590 [Roseomonas nepalensis]|uniref:Glycine zipper domain-containing protein n=1 Tax=Muricoccus nepalensis TaxID=1854500 RepID=A0A502FUS0_9PROT|nr:hypothetical protein [Roseomonas nepalensis]TPG53367.1 hypothetical protein EAH89_16590 [Roseomonas nepalensis]